MSATIEEMLQQQINIIHDLSKAMKQIIESCEYFQEHNDDLEKQLEAYKDEYDVMIQRIFLLEGQNFKLRKTIWKLKSEFECTCDGVEDHTCDTKKH